MTRPWQVLPVLAVAAVAASAWWWHAAKDAWRAPEPRRPELPQVVDIAARPVVQTRQAMERPVLWVSRRPSGTADVKGGLAQELMDSRLTAVFTSGPHQLAVLQRKDGSSLKLGADSKPWRIESFDGRKAVFVSTDQQRVERFLEYVPAPRPKSALPPGMPVRPAAQ
jgi:hypothetical protein